MTDDFPILASVAANPTHPYQLLEHLHSMGIKTTRSTLYRRVDALVEEGLLTSNDVRGPTGHFRRSIALARQGRARLAREAGTVLSNEPLESPLFGLAVAAAGAAGLAETLDVLRGRMSVAARKLTEEERALREFEDEPWNRAARERRVVHLQADIAWLQGLLSRQAA
jgi:DNA-binding PadR family transcriptional regulator